MGTAPSAVPTRVRTGRTMVSLDYVVELLASQVHNRARCVDHGYRLASSLPS